MNTKLLLGLAVVGGAAFFLTRKRPQTMSARPQVLVARPDLMSKFGPKVEATMRDSIRQSIVASGLNSQLAGSLMPIDGKTGTYQNLVAQIRAREIESGVV
jgi:hypothetical protein